jgi:hypothetical protein
MSSLRTLATAKLPVEFGTVEFNADGSLTRSEARPIRFGFDAFGVSFAAEVGAARRLTVSASLGLVPYTIESRDKRLDLAHVVAESRRALVGGTIEVDARQRVILSLADDIVGPITPSEVVVAATRLALRAQPWIALATTVTTPESR